MSEQVLEQGVEGKCKWNKEGSPAVAQRASQGDALRPLALSMQVSVILNLFAGFLDDFLASLLGGCLTLFELLCAGRPWVEELQYRRVVANEQKAAPAGVARSNTAPRRAKRAVHAACLSVNPD